MKAILVDPKAPACLAMGDAPNPEPAPGEALIRVTAFSLNRGEVRYAANKPAGTAIGWDLAGVVERAAADGSGPGEGRRVVGWSKASTAFAQYCAVPTGYLAAIPEGVTDETAACLPVAGLTALFVLERGVRLLGNRVLVTGATGGVGHLAVQLAAISGARVTAQVRQESQATEMRAYGAEEVIVTHNGAELRDAGPFQFIHEGIGGIMASNALKALGQGGTLVLYGPTMGDDVTISVMQMLASNSAQIQGFTLYKEDAVASVADGLARLLHLCRRGKLRTEVSVVESWKKTPETAQGLLDRKFAGKAVLRVGPD